MWPSTRSRSGVAKELERRLNKGGSRVDAPASVQIQQVLVESADEVRQQEVRGEQVEINIETSSYDTDNVNGD